MFLAKPTGFQPLLSECCGVSLLAGFCLLAGGAGGPLAASPTNETGQYLLKNWTTADGLPDDTVRAIVESRSGYFWLGTALGLARFDGVRFKVFNYANTPSFFGDDIYWMHEDRRGVLWVSTRRGLFRYQDGAFDVTTLGPNAAPEYYLHPAEDKAGRVWFHDATRLLRWDGTNLAAVPLTGGNPELIYDICPAADGGLWLAGKTNLWRSRDGALEPVHATPSPQIITTAPDGQLWGVVGGRKLFKLSGGTWSEVADFGEERCGTVFAARNGDIWVGAGSRNRAFRLRGGIQTEINQSDGLEGNRAIGFCEDRDGNIWLGMNGAGVYRLREPRLKLYDRKHGLQALSLSSVGEDANGDIFVNVMGWTLHRFNGESFTPLTIPTDTEHYEGPTALMPAHAGGMWAGTYAGTLARIVDGKVVERIGGPLGTRALFTDRNGDLWRGTRVGGLEHFSGTNRTLYTTNDGLWLNDIHCLAQSPDGDIWAGTEDGLNRIEHGRITRFGISHGLGHRFISALAVDSRGTLWVGTLGGGLSGWNGSRFVTVSVREGLADDTVTQLIEDDHEHLWIGTRAGLMRVALDQLHGFLAGHHGVVTGTLIGRNEGLVRPDTWTQYQPASIKARDGRLWFCTRSGVVVIDPKDFTQPAAPPVVHIEEVEVDGEICSAHRKPVDTITIGPGAQRVQIRYTGISPSGSELVRFRYRLKGFDRDWVEAGPTRFANYAQVNPGRYEFAVRAANNDGVWNEAGATLALIFEPAFWQTNWFRGVVLVLFLGSGPAVYLWRVRRLERRRFAQEIFAHKLIDSQEQERQRIAAELHDSLGQNLLVIKNRAALALAQQDQPDKMAAQMGEVSALASAAIREVREIAQNLRPFQLDELGLTKSINAMVRKLAESTPITFHAQLNDLDGSLRPEFEIHFYRVVQECLSNVVKHSRATAATIQASRENHTLRLAITDDGCGFAVTSPEADLTAGAGLGNIAERVRTMGGEVRFDSHPGRGTRITIVLPVQ